MPDDVTPDSVTLDQTTSRGVVVKNLETVLRREEESITRNTVWIDRFGDRVAHFVGTPAFVVAQLALMTLWVAANSRAIPGVAPWDAYPFSLLSALVSSEGVLLTAFVVIRQNRMNALSDRRDHLDLQINLLAEREVTRLLQMTERIAQRLGVDESAGDLAEETSVDKLLGHLDEKLSAPTAT